MTNEWHRLTSINSELRTANCSVCGPVDITARGNATWRCGNKHRQTQRKVDAKRNPRRSTEAHFGRPLKEITQAKEKFLEKQGGRCGICEKPLTLQNRALDHDHETNQLRGMLCRVCNAGLGMLGDNEDALLRALAYIRAVG